MIAGYPGAEKFDSWTWKLQEQIQLSKQWLHTNVFQLRRRAAFFQTTIASNIATSVPKMIQKIELHSRYLRSVTMSCALSMLLFMGLHTVSALGEQTTFSAGDIATLQQHFSDEAIFINGTLLWSKQARTSSPFKPQRVVTRVASSSPISTSDAFAQPSIVEGKGILAQLRSFNDKGHRDNKRAEIVIQSRWGLRKSPQQKDNSLLALIHWLLLKEEQSPEYTI